MYEEILLGGGHCESQSTRPWESGSHPTLVFAVECVVTPVSSGPTSIRDYLNLTFRIEPESVSHNEYFGAEKGRVYS